MSQGIVVERDLVPLKKTEEEEEDEEWVDSPDIPDEVKETQKRGAGSIIASVCSFLAGAGLLAWGVTLCILSYYRAGEGKGELPIVWYVFAKVFHSKNVSPGYILGGTMAGIGGFILLEMFLLYPPIYQWLCGRANSKGRKNERRFDPGRRRRRSLRMIMTWWAVPFALLQSTGAYEEPLYYMVVASIIGSMTMMFVAQDTSSRFKNNQKLAFFDGNVIALANGMAFILAAPSIVILWVYYTRANWDSTSPTTNRLGAAFYIFTIVYFIDWLLTSLASTVRTWKAQEFLFTLFNAPQTALHYIGWGKGATYIMNNGLTEELYTIGKEVLVFAITSWLVYDDVVQEWKTVPL